MYNAYFENSYPPPLDIQRRLGGRNILTGRFAFIGGRTGFPVALNGWVGGKLLLLLLLARAGGGGGGRVDDTFSAGCEDAALALAVLGFFWIGRSSSFALDGSDSADSSSATTRFLFGTKTSAGLMVGSIGRATAGFT